MDSLLFKGYEFISSFIPYILLVILLGDKYNRRGLRISKGMYAMTAVFAVYVVAVFHYTGAGTLFNLMYYGFNISMDKINLIPFSRGADIIESGLNILLFVPFGFIVPIVFRNFTKVKDIAKAGFAFSLLIELSQLLNIRSTDIDDLIFNTMGAVIGYIIYRAASKLIRGKENIVKLDSMDLFMMIAVMFAGRFIFYYEMGLAKILYNF